MGNGKWEQKKKLRAGSWQLGASKSNMQHMQHATCNISHDLPVGRTVGKGPSGGTPYETRKACEHDGVISKDVASAWQALVLAEDFADMHFDQRVFRYHNLLALDTSFIRGQLCSDKEFVRKWSGFSTSCH
jgi:hypothetical protein